MQISHNNLSHTPIMTFYRSTTMQQVGCLLHIKIAGKHMVPSVACELITMRGTAAPNSVEMPGVVATKCVEMRGTATRKCLEMGGTAACVWMWVARTPRKPRFGFAGREWGACGTCGLSAAQTRGAAVPSIGGSRIYTGKLRVKNNTMSHNSWY